MILTPPYLSSISLRGQVMPRFIYLEPGLTRPGGHYFEYATCLLSALERAGWEIHLVTHRQFQQAGLVPETWQVHPTFDRELEFASMSMSGGRNLPSRAAVAQLPWYHRKQLGLPLAWLSRKLRSLWTSCTYPQRFAADLATLFEKLGSRSDDFVFVATVSDLWLQGLQQFWDQPPQPQLAHWQIQFHNNLFSERDTECQRERERVRIQQFLARVFLNRPLKLTLSTTTQDLAEQYQELKLGTFEELPYPFQRITCSATASSRTGKRPVRITVAGQLRFEQGRFEADRLVKDLWPDYLATGRAQMAFQVSNLRTRELLYRLGSQQTSVALDFHPLDFADFPLSRSGYQEWIARTDLSVFLYSREEYSARCSGILGEMLSAGIPVVVPAGCWMARQIAEPWHAHVESLARRLPRIEFPAAIICEHQQVTCEHDRAWMWTGALPGAGTELLIAPTWPQTTRSGQALQIQATFLDRHGHTLSVEEAVVAPRERSPHTPILLARPARAERVTVSLGTAFRRQSVVLPRLDLGLLDGSREPGGTCARSAVGMVVPQPRLLRRCVLEVLENLAHYQQTATDFAPSWSAAHSSQRTVDVLLARCAPQAERPLEPISPARSPEVAHVS